MDFETYAQRLDYLLNKIKEGQLESPRQLEQHFNCSERTVRKMINSLRHLGHTVEYCRKTKKYVLSE